MKIYESHSYIEPPYFDNTSSPTTNYYNMNIIKKKIDDVDVYEYVVVHLAKDEQLNMTKVRERLYETYPIIKLDEDMVVVDEANRICLDYLAEGNEKANELRVLIAEAKNNIRQKFPDIDDNK